MAINLKGITYISAISHRILLHSGACSLCLNTTHGNFPGERTGSGCSDWLSYGPRRGAGHMEAANDVSLADSVLQSSCDSGIAAVSVVGAPALDRTPDGVTHYAVRTVLQSTTAAVAFHQEPLLCLKKRLFF